jgi:hypothetical protein
VIVDEKFRESDRRDLKMGNRDFVFPSPGLAGRLFFSRCGRVAAMAAANKNLVENEFVRASFHPYRDWVEQTTGFHFDPFRTWHA